MRFGGGTGFSILQTVVFCFFAFVFLSQRTVKSQNLPPARNDGFLYTNQKVDSETIMIDAFFDPVCPDSRDAWPPLKKVVQHYGPHVSLTVHLFPLPYHDNAFATSRALHIVNQLDTSATFKLLEAFFEHQEKFYNTPTQNLSRIAVVNEIIKFSAAAIGSVHYSAIKSGFSDFNSDLKTRISFKYSASRGVYGTPIYYVNGFVLPDAGYALSFEGWKKVIDPLLSAKNRNSYYVHHMF